jgi:signal transduction histidine kinase/ActR/RegA family two-component response regulator
MLPHNKLRKLLILTALCLIGLFADISKVKAENELDSLETLLPYANDVQRVDILNAIALVVKNTNPTQSIDFAKQAFNLSNKLNYDKGRALAHIVFGIHEKRKSDYEKAHTEFLLGLSQALKCKDLGAISLAYHSLGNLANIKGDYPKALRYYLGSLKISEDLHDNKRVSKTLNNIGGIYLEMENYDKAEQFYLRAYELEKLVGDELSLAELANNLANIYNLRGSEIKALYYYNNCLEVFKKLGSINDISTVLNNIGSIYTNKGQVKKALVNLYEALTFDDRLNDKHDVISTYQNLAAAHVKLNNRDSALFYAEKVTNMAKQLNFKKDYALSLELMSSMYENFGETVKALYYKNEAEKAKKEVVGPHKANEMADLQMDYAGKQKQSQINKLAKDNETKKLELQDKELSLQRKNVLLLGFGLGIFFLILISFMLFYLITSNRKRKVLEISSETKSNILNKVNSELRNPLNSIIGLSGLAGESRNLTELKENLSGIKSSSDELLFVMNNIIHYLQVDSGNSKLFPIKFNLIDNLQPLLKSYQHQCHSKGLLFSQMVYPDVPQYLIADKFKFLSIIDNLLSNALKYSESGVIKFEMKAAQSESKNEQNKITIQIKVSDEGSGIDSHKLKNVFKPTADSDTLNNKKSGFGVGLFLTQYFAKKMQGKVEVQSVEGQGTEFTVYLNVEAVPVELLSEHHLNDSFKTGPIQILIAQNNPTNQKVLVKMLESKGHICTVVSNGEEALNKLTEKSFDILLMDIKMPIMDGLKAAYHIRKDDEFELDRNIPIIAISADADEEDIQKCFEAGINDFLVKPIKKEVLIAKIEELQKQKNNTKAHVLA